jgi:hypothetical protein
MATVNPELLEALAADIGQDIYLDVAKWHLYLKDAQLHTSLAEKLYPLLMDKPIREEQVTQALRSTPVKIGGGKDELPLLALLPTQGIKTLMDILEKYQRQM